MRRLIYLPSKLKGQLPIFNNDRNLTFKSMYCVRSQKKKQPFIQIKAQVQKTNKQQNNQGQNQQNPNQQQPQNKIRLTGPKRLLQLLKEGNLNIIPFYIKNMTNNAKNISLPYEIPSEQKLQEQQSPLQKPTASSTAQNTEMKKQEDNTKAQSSYIYPFKSSALYKQRLLKKYKIIQSLKASQKLQINFFKLKLPSDFDLKMFTSFIQKLMKDRTRRSFVFKASFYIAFFVAFFALISLSGDNNTSSSYYFDQANQLSISQIQSKLNDVKQIRVDTDKSTKNQLSFVFNQERNLNPFQIFASLLGFDVQKNKVMTFNTPNPNLILDGLQNVQEHKNKQDWVKIKPSIDKYTIANAFFDTLFLATPFFGLAITYWIFKKINPDTMMKGLTSNKKSMKIQSTKDIKVRFKDVAGMQGAKKQITQFVDFLKKSDKYVQMGAKIPKGALLTGPPGTGKTMLAKACAGQAGTSFFYVSGSQFVEMFVGLGASRVRQLFARARQEAPSIIFIDQIDAIGKKRETSRNQQKDSTLNQMLVQMDGFSSSQTVIVLAATNRKDILDSALTRPGRFDRIVEIALPQIKARQQIFMVHLSPLKINPDKPLSEIAKRLAELTPGFSGADIANLCNQAAIIATRKKRKYIEDADFEEASQRIMAGYIKKGMSNQKTRKRVAYHEAGHAVCGWYLKGGDPLVKLTIIPRSKGALGYAQYLPKTAYIRTKTQLIDQISIMLGGTTSQQIFLGNMSSGNSDDLQKVYSLTRRMVTQFGMGQKTYNMTLDEQRYVSKQSQKLCDTMDKQILEIVNEATKRAKQILQQKRQIVEQLTKQLLQKQTINSNDILRIMGQRPAFN